MTPLEIYESFIIKANENAQTDNVAVSRDRFAVLYNEAAIKFVEWTLEKRNEDDIRYLAPILVPAKLIDFTGDKTYQAATLPEDYLDLANINTTASSSCCTRVDMEMWEIKVENENTILNDEFNKPSIDYREAPYYIKEGQIKILVDNFTIDVVNLMYYKYPTKIEVLDPDNPESGFSNPDTNLDFDEKAINKIVSIAVADYNLNNNNPRYQADLGRVVNKF